MLILPVLLLLSAVLGFTSAQTTSCVNAGYDLTSITGADLFWNGTGNLAGTGTNYQWAIRPCGTVTTPGFCSGAGQLPGEFCQAGTTISTMNVSGSGVLSGAIWAQTQMNGQYGVAQFLQDGTNCGGNVGDREGTIVYLCNRAATTPYISSLLELSICNYQAIIQTAAICPQVPYYGVSTTQGTTILTNTCGGGIYDFTSLNSADIVNYVSGNTWAIRVCGVLSSISNCSANSANTSICQYGSNYNYVAGNWLPGKSNTFYQYLAPGAVSQIMQDGQACGAQERLTNVTFYCNATATTPFISGVSEYATCHYALSVQTSSVCGTAFAGLQTSTGPVVPAAQNPTAGATSVTVTSAPAVVSTGPSPTPAPTISTGSVYVTSVPGVQSTGSAATTIPVTNPTAPTNPGNGGVATSSLSLLAVMACGLVALIWA